ncbi:MAG: hypothetical protein ACRCXT_00075 [Paraclostridium sp.]
MVSRQIINKTLHTVEEYVGKTFTKVIKNVSKAEGKLLRAFRESGGVTVESS